MKKRTLTLVIISLFGLTSLLQAQFFNDSVIINSNGKVYNSLFATNEYLFVTDVDSIYVIDISTKLIMSSAVKSVGGGILKYAGGKIIMRDYYNVFIYDATDLNNIYYQETLGGFNKSFSGATNKTDLLTIGWEHWAQKINIVDFSSGNLVEVSNPSAGGNPQGAGQIGNFLYISNAYQMSKRFDITDPANPVSSNFGVQGTYLRCTENYVVIENYFGGNVVSIWTQENIQLASKSPAYLKGPLSSDDDFIFLEQNGIIKLYDISDGTFDNYIATPPRPIMDYNDSYWFALDSDEIILYPRLFPLLNLPDTIYSCAGESVELDAGLGFVNYLWSTGETTQTIIVIETGNYFVTVEDTEGSFLSDTSFVHFTDSIQINLPDTLFACYEDSLILDAGAGFENYLWSTGDTAQTLAVFHTGTYAVTVEDSFGCTATDSTYVNIINAHLAQNDTTIVTGESIELSIIGGGFANITDGLVAWYPFNGNSYDESGNGNDGTVNGPILTNGRFGNSNSAYYFDGSNDYIVASNSPSFSASTLNNTTVCAWVKANSFTSLGGNQLVHLGGNYTQNSYEVYYQRWDEKITAMNYKWQGPWLSCLSTFIPNLDEWYLITVVYDNENSFIRLYVNGIFNNELSASLNKPVDPRVEIGRNPWGEGYHHGTIDDIRIYARVLSHNEIQTLYYEGTGNYTYLWSNGDTTATISVMPTETTTYYCEITDGINWCTDSVTVTIEHLVELELKAFLEGPYLNNNMPQYLNLLGFIPDNQPYNTAPWNYEGGESVMEFPQTVVDWILIELRETDSDASTATSDKIVARKACFINNDGNIVELDGSSPVNINAELQGNNLFVALKHRNHLPVLSAYPLELANGIYPYDFTTFAEQSFGSEHACSEIDIDVWGLTSGNGDGDYEVDNLDKNEIWVPAKGNFGYYKADFNLDGQVNESDKAVKWEPNAGKGTKIFD